jgi:hypothetical protein
VTLIGRRLPSKGSPTLDRYSRPFTTSPSLSVWAESANSSPEVGGGASADLPLATLLAITVRINQPLLLIVLRNLANIDPFCPFCLQ